LQNGKQTNYLCIIFTTCRRLLEASPPGPQRGFIPGPPMGNFRPQTPNLPTPGKNPVGVYCSRKFYLTQWPATCVTCCAPYWNNFHPVYMNYTFLLPIRYITLWCWRLITGLWTSVVYQCDVIKLFRWNRTIRGGVVAILICPIWVSSGILDLTGSGFFTIPRDSGNI